MSRHLIVSAWEHARETLTQEEFCQTVGVSRTSLWRYLKGECNRRRSAGGNACSKGAGWQERARELAKLHPTYGYRRIRVMLKKDGLVVGQHCLRRWMRAEGLSQCGPVVDRGRTVGDRPAEPDGLNVAWQMDATKIYTNCDGWIWQTSVLDVFNREVVSCVVRKTCRAEDAQDALALALDARFGMSRAPGLSVIHDRGSQFTSFSFKGMVERCGAKNVTTAVRHPQSCGRLERFHRTLKEELIWQQEWEEMAEVKAAVEQWLCFYNDERPHSALGYQSPREFSAAATLQKQAA